MPGIDAHQHFWKYNPARDAWIDDTMTPIRKDFTPSDLQPVLKANGIDGCVIVQSDQSEAENEFQLTNAENNDFIKGIVGWIDLRAENAEDRLTYYKEFKKMKGFRHVLQSEAQRDFMLRADFGKGISLLKKYGFTYDILILADQLKYIPEFVKKFPEQSFIIDHLGKPEIKKNNIREWQKNIKIVANYRNVHCKISGMITEADWSNWNVRELIPYIDTVVEAFGIHRIMFGSDWPVCLLAGTYEEVCGVVRNYFSSFTQDEQDLFFGNNAVRFYNLDKA